MKRRKGYFEAMNEFCTDPVTGKAGPMDNIMFGFVILASPILLPLYYIGILSPIIDQGGDGA